MATKILQSDRPSGDPSASQREQVFDSYRRWGYLQARLDPLEQYLLPEDLPELKETNEFTEEARGYYCSTIGAEFMHIPEMRKRQWIQERMEQAPAPVDQQEILERLLEADVFEQVIQSRYLGTKRFSLEGVTVLIPFLDEMLNRGAEHGTVQSMMGMSHRGRLNVMVNTIGRSPVDVFSKFEDVNPRSILGGGD
ncbi:MAG TPA: 2-oxoglutarate dehydrogenase E1 component, partial [Acidobacteriaceae bacterium]|nr:2-oxoglutarate dehydrogenase E1 component [Acidobacteriaceae bacterium]